MSMVEETIVLGDSADTFILDDESESFVLAESSVNEQIVLEYVGIAMPGTPGEPGIQGLPGPPGDSSEALGKEVDQIFPADPWDHYHNLPFEPGGQYYDTTGQTRIFPVREERYSGGIRVYWSDSGSRPIAGKAFYS